MTAITSASIAHIVGPVAVTEFDNAKDTYKEGLHAWALTLPNLSDEDFARECYRSIYDSALVNGFRGNWDHDHFKATACYHESERRHHDVAGHAKDCHGDTAYSRAHRQLMREHQYGTRPPTDCTCR